MTNLNNELTKKYSSFNYPMTTGSAEWQSIKFDTEVLDDKLAGLISFLDETEPDRQKVLDFRKELETFVKEVEAYQPQDDLEKAEKNVIIKKINLGLTIYSELNS